MRIVHCLNQFFGGLGGEESAGLRPARMVGPRGAGRLLVSLAPDIEVIATIVFGDNDLAERTEEGVREVLELIREGRPDVIFAGPAFAAGRYGIACGSIARAARTELGIPAVTALHPDNPAVPMFRRDVPIVAAGDSAMDMRPALEGMLRVARKLLRREPLDPATDGTLPRGVRRNRLVEQSGAERAVDMLLRKIRGEPFTSEYAMPSFDRVSPAPALEHPTTARIALVTSGGIVPRSNPDHIESANASRFGEYSLVDVTSLSAETHQTAHGGYDPTFANADPNRVLPVDVFRELEGEGRIGELHDSYFATVGNGTSVDRARRFGTEIAARLSSAGVQAVILTST